MRLPPNSYLYLYQGVQPAAGCYAPQNTGVWRCVLQPFLWYITLTVVTECFLFIHAALRHYTRMA